MTMLYVAMRTSTLATLDEVVTCPVTRWPEWTRDAMSTLKMRGGALGARRTGVAFATGRGVGRGTGVAGGDEAAVGDRCRSSPRWRAGVDDGAAVDCGAGWAHA